MSSAFAKFWQNDLVRDCFLSCTERQDMCKLRLVSRDFAATIAPVLFKETQIHFSANTFMRRSRMAALERVGHYIKKVSFILPHTTQTFLPPLLSPDTLEEITFVYEPQISVSRPSSSSSSSSSSSYSSSKSRYGSWEINDLLIKHYPSLFHAATNIPAFVRAFNTIPNLQDLCISCPGQNAGQRYRRDVVDYALISLRIALERANPRNFTNLTLDSIHPAATVYLRPQMSIGASPGSTRIWRRIKKLNISMMSFEYGRNLPTDHLKALHGYLQSFPSLEHLDFEWIGDKGPSPLSLDAEPCTSRPTSLDSSNACPKSCEIPSCKPIRFRHLKSMRLNNACLDASQASAFIMSHRKVLFEFNFEQCQLRSGTWDDALAPLTRISGNNDWKRKPEEVMDVPIMLSPIATTQEECIRHAMWDEGRPRCRRLDMLKRVGLKLKPSDMVPEHVKRIFKASRVAWQ